MNTEDKNTNNIIEHKISNVSDEYECIGGVCKLKNQNFIESHFTNGNVTFELDCNTHSCVEKCEDNTITDPSPVVVKPDDYACCLIHCESRNDIAMFRDYVDKKSFDKPVIVQFSAPWCGPCRQMKPIVEKHAKDNQKCHFLYVDVDQLSKDSIVKKINSLPTFHIYMDGRCVMDNKGGCILDEDFSELITLSVSLFNEKPVTTSTTTTT